jgi:hypothetical protein
VDCRRQVPRYFGSDKARQAERSLLEIAVETGFHSLVELIAKHGTNQSAKDAALADAAS